MSAEESKPKYTELDLIKEAHTHYVSLGTNPEPPSGAHSWVCTAVTESAKTLGLADDHHLVREVVKDIHSRLGLRLFYPSSVGIRRDDYTHAQDYWKACYMARLKWLEQELIPFWEEKINGR